MDGSNPWQTFWKVVTFPVMRPINIVVLVVTVIESLRAFDLVYITNKGINGVGAVVGPRDANWSERPGESASVGFWALCCYSSP